ncbi:MAG: SCO family protein [Bacteroidetes bacterium]|nr:SCO family protein [Bacteroidota bacterium]
MKKYITPAILILCLVSLLVWAYKQNLSKPLKELKIYGNEGHVIKDFKFTDQDGKTWTLKDTKGKVMAVEFFFTQCGSICPVMNEQMMRVDSAFKNNDNFMIMSHTVKPEEDSLPLLKEYANMHNASKNWHFLTGTQEELYTIGRTSYLLDADGIPEFLHTSFFTIVDKLGRLRGFYDGIKPDEVSKMIIDISILLEE